MQERKHLSRAIGFRCLAGYRLFLRVMVLAAVLLLTPPASGETVTELNYDSRTVVALRVDPAAPKYFTDMLQFPYLDGLSFVVAAYRRGGWKELDRIHTNPPRSTR